MPSNTALIVSASMDELRSRRVIELAPKAEQAPVRESAFSLIRAAAATPKSALSTGLSPALRGLLRSSGARVKTDRVTSFDSSDDGPTVHGHPVPSFFLPAFALRAPCARRAQRGVLARRGAAV